MNPACTPAHRAAGHARRENNTQGAQYAEEYGAGARLTGASTSPISRPTKASALVAGISAVTTSTPPSSADGSGDASPRSAFAGPVDPARLATPTRHLRIPAVACSSSAARSKACTGMASFCAGTAETRLQPHGISSCV